MLKSNGVPTSDEQVFNIFNEYSQDLKPILIGLYKCLRSQGKSVPDAYKDVIESHIPRTSRR